MISSLEDLRDLFDDHADDLASPHPSGAFRFAAAVVAEAAKAAASEPTEKGDVLNGTTGADVIDGLAGNDKIFGRAGDDALYGGAGADTIRGGKGDDDLFGGANRDKLIGGEGSDDLDGGSGADYLDGGLGDDFIIGGDGKDTIVGGGGNDLVTGGAGKDLFVVQGGVSEVLSIADFVQGEDRIEISGVADVDGFTDIRTEFGGCGLVVTDETASFSIVLFGYFGALTEADFLFS